VSTIIKKRSESLNFYNSVVTLIFIALGIWGIETTLDPTELVKNIFEKNWDWVISVAIPSIITLGFKLYQKIVDKAINFKLLLKSPNFVTQALTVLAVLLGWLGITFGPDMPQAVTTAIMTGSVFTIFSALIAHVLNPIWHFIKDKFFNKPK
jgi:uncharacterized membrane protein